MYLQFFGSIGVLSITQDSDRKINGRILADCVFSLADGSDCEFTLTAWPNAINQIAYPSVDQAYFLEGKLIIIGDKITIEADRLTH